MQAVFEVLGRQTKMLLPADTTHEVWTDIVGNHEVPRPSRAS